MTLSWTYDHSPDNRRVLRTEVHVTLPGVRSRRVSGAVDVERLSRVEQSCLFEFRAVRTQVTASQAGRFRAEPTFDPAAILASYVHGEALDVLGQVIAPDGAGGNWSVVEWRDPETREWRNVFVEGLLPGSGVWADSAYRSKDIEKKVKAKGLTSRIHRKAYRNRPLQDWEKAGNRRRSRFRARVEHVFGAQQNDMGGTVVRSIGLVRARTRIGLKNLAYNMRRLVHLQGLARVS